MSLVAHEWRRCSRSPRARSEQVDLLSPWTNGIQPSGSLERLAHAGSCAPPSGSVRVAKAGCRGWCQGWRRVHGTLLAPQCVRGGDGEPVIALRSPTPLARVEMARVEIDLRISCEVAPCNSSWSLLLEPSPRAEPHCRAPGLAAPARSANHPSQLLERETRVGGGARTTAQQRQAALRISPCAAPSACPRPTSVPQRHRPAPPHPRRAAAGAPSRHRRPPLTSRCRRACRRRWCGPPRPQAHQAHHRGEATTQRRAQVRAAAAASAIGSVAALLEGVALSQRGQRGSCGAELSRASNTRSQRLCLSSCLPASTCGSTICRRGWPRERVPPLALTRGSQARGIAASRTRHRGSIASGKPAPGERLPWP